jgi:AcrR family transcriptional regulator
MSARAAAAPATPRRASRVQVADARERVLNAGLRLFAAKGFAKTSTREIALAAGANVAAISYYFGDKAGLYRAVFAEPTAAVKDEAAPKVAEAISLHASLEGFFSGFLQPLKQGELAQQRARLQLREMLQPSGLWSEQPDHRVRPAHKALLALICRELKVAEPDDEIHRLAFALIGMALQMLVSRELIEAVRPQLIATPRAIDDNTERLAAYAEALIAFEGKRRAEANVRPRRKETAR